MRTASRKFQRDLCRWAAERGWSWRHTGSGHLRFDHPRCIHPVFTPSTPKIDNGNKERAKLATALKRAIAAPQEIA